MFDDRKFLVEIKEQPALDTVRLESDAKLFAGLTQETVEMDRRVNIEHQEMLAAVAEESAARASMDTTLAKSLTSLTSRIAALEKRVKALEGN